LDVDDCRRKLTNHWLKTRECKYGPGELKLNSKERKSSPAFFAVDFFCGAGGMTLGMLDANGYVIGGVDKDIRCERTYVENNVNRHLDHKAPKFLAYDIFPATIETPDGQQNELIIELRELITKYRCANQDVPLLFAVCAPCQPFTKISKKKLSDKRREGRAKDTNLLQESTKFISEFLPEFIISENVEGIRKSQHGETWGKFCQSLEELGYVVGSKVVCASRFGIPQYRKRSILLAVKKELVKEERFADLLKTELLLPEADPNSAMVSVTNAIGHLPPLEAGEAHAQIPNHRTRNLSELNLKRLRAAKPGKSNAYMDESGAEELSLDCHRRVNKKLKQRCFTDVYTRMFSDRPSPTITTKCHSISNGRFGHYDITQNRGISLREAALLQSFPMNYVFHPKNMTEPIARMIGNAVPPKLAEFFVRYLTDSIVE
jgi:DNA (cytosine-5)-methyltransferase 1